MKRKGLAIEIRSDSESTLREGDRRLLKLLQLDLAFTGRQHGRCVAGEPQAVVELLNAPVEEPEDL